ncbi:MAG: glycosyl hydrolase family 25 [Ruminococcus sp.]|nr:glycosyl hydrolase family 25 [Ruminococcus sp.]MCD7811578.1 glycosyl hydrolase family 25 [Ruminococcus sp.]
MEKIKKIILILLGIIMIGAAGMVSVYFSEAIVNKERFPVMGVDVSHYQGEIDWQELERQNVSFAFIKATEGSGHIDEFARRNLESAAETNIKISAYHFFSFDSSGETQAENYISVVGKDDINMPPVVDIEYYGDKSANKPDGEELEKILTPLMTRLEDYYGVKPIIYTTLAMYNKYKEYFSDYPLWIRSVYCEPEFVQWKFWQYSDKGELYGFVGEEQYIDLNVYNGSEEEFYDEYSE